ncbi:hypothetical protein FGO68_gene12770 [Halteria grandinella]|uniref:Uncharacterized protein n=1 Tax=Halteria grandinella TaxID=5974 RepID=A0A8J8T8S6_HALGN|nr:hypothetical protein FGO68_gene12770 [Halteria grandinella]
MGHSTTGFTNYILQLTRSTSALMKILKISTIDSYIGFNKGIILSDKQYLFAYNSNNVKYLSMPYHLRQQSGLLRLQQG